MIPTDLAQQLTAFFGAYLSGQRNLSPNTILAYRDTLGAMGAEMPCSSAFSTTRQPGSRR